MTVNFTGSVSAQTAEGETVTVTVTLPDASTETLTATTLADKTFATSKEYLPGDYSATATIEEDAEYKAAASSPVSFTIAKMDRTLTLTVNVA